MNNYLTVSIVGETPSSIIYLAQDPVSQKKLAIKQIKDGENRVNLSHYLISQFSSKALHEISTLLKIQRLNVPSVIHLENITVKKDNQGINQIAIVMDYYPYDLTSLIHEIRSKNPKSFVIINNNNNNNKTNTNSSIKSTTSSTQFSVLNSPKQQQQQQQQPPSLPSSPTLQPLSINTTLLLLTESQKRFIIYKLFLALQQLHANELIHGDIKPSNILLDKDGNPYLTDFGNTFKQNRRYYLPLYTQWYRPPEILRNEIIRMQIKQNKEKHIVISKEESERMLKNYIKPTTYCDCWSIGVTIAELYTGKTLFPCTAKENRSQAQYKYITEILGKPISKNGDYNWSNINKFFDDIKRMPSDAKQLIKSLLHFNPAKRASITQCLNFEFFTNVKLMDLSSLLSQIRPLHEYQIKLEKLIQQQQKNNKMMKIESVKRKNSIDSSNSHNHKHFKSNS